MGLGLLPLLSLAGFVLAASVRTDYFHAKEVRLWPLEAREGPGRAGAGGRKGGESDRGNGTRAASNLQQKAAQAKAKQRAAHSEKAETKARQEPTQWRARGVCVVLGLAAVALVGSLWWRSTQQDGARVVDLGTVVGVLRKCWPELCVTLKNAIFRAKSNFERKAALLTLIAMDPHVARRRIHAIEGAYALEDDGAILLPRDWDLFVRCCTELGHRGECIPMLFDKWFVGSALNAQPKKYGKCPVGEWDTFKDQEPHLLSKDEYPAQVKEMEEIIDQHMESLVGKTGEVGKILRLLVWNLYFFSSYGVRPSEETVEMLQLFEDQLPEFDYALRMCAKGLAYNWSDDLRAQVQRIGDFCTKVANERAANIDACAHQTDVLTHMLLKHPDMDVKKMEGALRGCFMGGQNNAHSTICGVLIWNAKHGDRAHKYYMQNPAENIEHLLRESLRLYTSVPTSRTVRPEDDFSVDGHKLKPGAKALFNTYAINTDPRYWENPLDFDPSRFAEGMDELGFMCQRGFAPLGVAAELGGRACGARYHDVHMMRVAMGKLLRGYKFTEVGSSGYFDFKQNSGTSMYAGHCVVQVERR